MRHPRLDHALARVWVIALALTCACVHPRNFRSPRERLTTRSAYAETARVRLDVGLLEVDSQPFVVNLGVTVAALPSRLDLSINLAHGLAGIASLQSKFTLYDSRWYALGGRVGLTYMNPRTLWFLPKDLRRELGGVHLLSAPIELWNSFPLLPWFGFHLGVGYRATGVWGDYRGDELIVDASLAQRSLAFMPYLEVFIARRLALSFGGRLPVMTSVVEAADVRVEVAPELMVGVRSVEWVRRRFENTLRLELAAETRFGRNTHLRVAVHLWGFRPLLPIAATPELTLYWRF
ncbi:MAG: hypothetical protein HC927_10300 [Deltaproteobacteria bacterium]|nr:hypothetical protein [Deltaproteobacteria bacterium]